jgi:hypothetical protein
LGSYCARTILAANGLRSKMTLLPRRSDKRHHYSIPDTSTIVLSALGQMVQADQEVDHASTKSVRDEPDADDDARAWTPRMTCQGCRPVRDIT